MSGDVERSPEAMASLCVALNPDNDEHVPLRTRVLAAHALLDSDWLAKHDAEVAAKAWDEGQDAGNSRHRRLAGACMFDGVTNPYRADGLAELPQDAPG